jgi:uncharacterized membrane protein YqjE
VKRPPLVDVAKNAAEDLLDLMTAQLKLIRLELASDVGTAIKRTLRLALFVPPLLVGYAFGMLALASWLAGTWGYPLAFALVAALQIIPAGSGVAWTVRSLRNSHPLERAGAEVTGNVRQALAAVSDRGSSSHG